VVNELQLIITDSVQDCWFLAALCAVAKTGQGFMMSHIRRTKGEGDVAETAEFTIYDVNGQEQIISIAYNENSDGLDSAISQDAW
jgi:uncharacterized membrane protein